MHTQSLDRALVLSGQAPIHDFVRFVRTRAIDGQRLDEIALTEEWKCASRHLRDLQHTESKFADVGELEPLPAQLATKADAVLQDPATRKSLSFLPHRWAIVELDRLIVWQKYINLEFADRVRSNLSPHPSADELLGVATGVNHELPPLHVTTLSSNSYAFSSASTDVRVLGTALLNPAEVDGNKSYGRPAAVLAVYFGYSINVMWAVHMGDRIMLVNGTHRAYALRAAGVTHAPCVVSRIASRDDLDLVGLPESTESTGSYFAKTRPPLLKDYFDDRLYKPISMPRTHNIIQLDLKFERTRLPV